jgi:hypothetical protein
VVAFIKGTRTEPACGFTFKVLTMLNEVGAEYEVVNVLDETYNPGVRDAIKQYSQWPTIPQVGAPPPPHPTGTHALGGGLLSRQRGPALRAGLR